MSGDAEAQALLPPGLRPRGGVAETPGAEEPCIETSMLEDALTWVEVYRELTAFWDRALAGLAAQPSGPIRDLHLLQDHHRRLRRRHLAWELRARELDRSSHPPAPG